MTDLLASIIIELSSLHHHGFTTRKLLTAYFTAGTHWNNNKEEEQ